MFVLSFPPYRASAEPSRKQHRETITVVTAIITSIKVITASKITAWQVGGGASPGGVRTGRQGRLRAHIPPLENGPERPSKLHQGEKKKQKKQGCSLHRNASGYSFGQSMCRNVRKTIIGCVWSSRRMAIAIAAWKNEDGAGALSNRFHLQPK